MTCSSEHLNTIFLLLNPSQTHVHLLVDTGRSCYTHLLNFQVGPEGMKQE